MKSARKTAGFAIATAVAGLFAAGSAGILSAEPAKESAKVQCAGINACKGQGECATASNACKGENGCKGQGVREVSRQECEAAGGTIVKG